MDDILKSRLHDVEIREGLPDWERIEKSVIAAEKEGKKRKTLFLLGNFYRYAAIGLILIGMGYVGYKYIVKSTQNKYVAGNVNSEVVQKSSNTVTAEGMGVENNTAQVEYKPVQEVSPDSEVITTVNVSLSAMPPSSEVAILPEADNNSEYVLAKENDVDRYSPFFAEIPELSALVDSRNGLIHESGTRLYDIEEYLAEFNKLYEGIENDKSIWQTVLLADALSINKSNGIYQIAEKESLRFNSYVGKVNNNKDLVKKIDNLLVANFFENFGTVMSEQEYERLAHLFPVSFSVGVSRDLGTRIGIESGLLYSYMKSFTGKRTWTSIYFEQKLQYIGVPVTIYYSLLPKNSNWDIDLRGGITAEKALSAKGTTTIYENYIATESSVNNDLPSNIMLSGHAGVGFGYSLFKNFGLYAEPAFEYYFYTEGQPISYKTDNPFRFNIRAGVRFNF